MNSFHMSALLIVCGSLVPVHASAQTVVPVGPLYMTGEVQIFGENEQTSNSVPSIFLTQSVSQVVTGDLGGSPWFGSVQANVVTTLSSDRHWGELNVASHLIVPTQPDPNLPDTPFEYQAGAGSVVSGELSYEFKVIGPGPTASVVFTENGTLTTSSLTGDGYQSVYASLQVNNGTTGATVINDQLNAAYGISGDSIYNVGNTVLTGSPEAGYFGQIYENQSYTFEIGQIYTLTMIGAIDNGMFTSSYGDGSGNATFVPGGAMIDGVTLDPGFAINPNMPDANLYSIIFSPGVAGSIPEPPTWIMLVSGFAGVGFLGNRALRRRAATMA